MTPAAPTSSLVVMAMSTTATATSVIPSNASGGERGYWLTCQIYAKISGLVYIEYTTLLMLSDAK